MSQQSQRPPTVIEHIDLHRLEPPEHDVRDHRDPDQVKSIARSMEESGQLQAAYVFPHDEEHRMDPNEATTEDLRELVTQDIQWTVHDGWTRREAARVNHSDTLRCECFPTEPDDAVPSRLDANTERIQMNDYETWKSIKEWAEDNGKTQEEVAHRVGCSQPTVSHHFRALDAPEWLIHEWRNPDSVIEYGHVREVLGLPNEDLMEKCIQDAVEFERGVGAFRQTVKNTMKGWKRQQRDDRSKEERENDGKEQRAKAKEAQAPDQPGEDRSCVLCGDPAHTAVATPVCKEDYGLMTRLKTSGEALLGDGPETEQQAAQDDV